MMNKPDWTIKARFSDTISGVMLPAAKLILIFLTVQMASCGGRQALNDRSLNSPLAPTPLPTPHTVKTEDFEIELNAAWRMETEGESYIFNDEKNLRQITIAVMQPTEIAKKLGIEQVGREAIKLRQAAIRKISNGNATFSEIKSVKVRDGYDLTFSATDQAYGVKVRSTTFARPERIVTVTFNKYAPFPTDEELDRQFADILSKIKLKI
jgi:hypothetical protein